MEFSELTGSSGTIESPTYPKFLRASLTTDYRITVEQGSLIKLEFKDFTMFMDDDDEDEDCYSYIKIFNGYDDTAPAIDEYCGDIPEPLISETNALFIRYISSPYKSRFQLTWNAIEKNASFVSFNACDKNQIVTLSSETQIKNVTSPGYPYGYASNLDCEWTIVSALPSYRPILEFKDINLEAMDKCIADYVLVQRSREDGTWVDIAKQCELEMLSRRMYQGTPYLKVKFHTDYNKNETGFNATVYLGCGGNMKGPEGIIEYDSKLGVRLLSDCMWNITVGRGRKIQFEFLQMNLVNSTGPCDSHVIIKNGIDEQSPILGDGKYCGNNNRAIIPQTSSNRAFVEYNSASYSVINSFKLRYYEVQHECGGQIRLTTFNTNTTISSPNYPSIPPAHIQCIWTIIGPAGEQLKIDFLERFDMARTCSKEYVELREGSTGASPVIKTICGDKLPETQYTKANMLRVKFFTDVPTPNNGFKARISIGGCGGLVRASLFGVGYLTSPKYPGVGAYPANTSCDYRVIGPLNSFLKINILEIDLAEIKIPSRNEETVDDNCYINQDHLVIYSVVTPMNTTFGDSFVEAGKICGKIPPKEPILSLSNEILIRLRTFPRTQNLYKGFKLSFTTQLSSCGGILNADTGIFTSPGYPLKLNRDSCEWRITVKKGRRIKFEILDLDFSSSADRVQRLTFYSDFKYRARAGVIYNSTIPGPIYTSDNIAIVSWFNRLATNNRGFKIQFSSDEPTICEGDLNQSDGLIMQPTSSTEDIKSFTCYYKRNNVPIIPTSPNTGTIAFYFSDMDFGDSTTNCEFPRTIISLWSESDPFRFLAVLCSNQTKKTVLSPWPDMTIMARRASFYSSAIPSFVLRYKIRHKIHNCGGIFKGPTVIRNIPAANANYAVLDCAWSIQFENDESINIKLNNLNFKLPCEKEFINIYNGKTPMSPLITTICGNDAKIDPIISQGSKLFIEYHTDNFVGSSKDSVFELRAESNDQSCGGTLHRPGTKFRSPLDGNSYPSNTECIWELRANEGYHVGISFQDRFFIEQSNNCTKDYIEFFDYIDNNWVSIKKICGRDQPQPVNSTTSRMKVIFRTDDSGTGDGFTAIWHQNCGGVLTTDEKVRVLSSPGYPKNYGENLRCNYTFKASDSESFVNLKFLDFEIEDTGARCFYDNVTLYKKVEYATPTQYNKVGTYCGKNNPGQIRYKSEVLLSFYTDQNFNLKGFQVEYSIDKCGGWIQNSTSIMSPKIFRSNDVYEWVGPLTCTWNVSAPAGYHIVVRFEKMNMQYSEYCSYDYVQIIKGTVDDDKNSILRICNNLTNSQLRPVHIDSNEAIIKMRTDQTHDYVGFSALVIFQRNCNEKINLTKQNPIKILNKLDMISNNLDCAYQITGETLSVIKVTFNEMHLSDCHPDQKPNNTCGCDYLEFYDGYGPFSPFIERVCGHDIEREIFSTGSSIFVRYVTDSTLPSTGFKLTFTMQESPCGSQTYYNFTDNENMIVTLSSKVESSTGSYPPNMRCVYLFEAPYRKNYEISFSKFDLEDSEGCVNDYLKIEDDTVRDYITEGLGQEVSKLLKLKIKISTLNLLDNLPGSYSICCFTKFLYGCRKSNWSSYLLWIHITS